MPRRRDLESEPARLLSDASQETARKRVDMAAGPAELHKGSKMELGKRTLLPDAFPVTARNKAEMAAGRKAVPGTMALNTLDVAPSCYT
jgi:hypothetical protein